MYCVIVWTREWAATAWGCQTIGLDLTSREGGLAFELTTSSERSHYVTRSWQPALVSVDRESCVTSLHLPEHMSSLLPNSDGPVRPPPSPIIFRTISLSFSPPSTQHTEPFS